MFETKYHKERNSEMELSEVCPSDQHCPNRNLNKKSFDVFKSWQTSTLPVLMTISQGQEFLKLPLLDENDKHLVLFKVIFNII